MAEIYTYDRTLQNLIKRFDNLESMQTFQEMVYPFENRQKRMSESSKNHKNAGGISCIATICVILVSINGLCTLIKTNLILEINDSKRVALTERDYRIAIKKFMIFVGRRMVHGFAMKQETYE